MEHSSPKGGAFAFNVVTFAFAREAFAWRGKTLTFGGGAFALRVEAFASAARRSICPNTCDNHRKAACRRLRDSMTAVVDFCNDIDVPDWYDRIGEMNKRHTTSQRRRVSS